MNPEEPGGYNYWLRKMLFDSYPAPEKKDMPTFPQEPLHARIRELYESRIPSIPVAGLLHDPVVTTSTARRSDHHTDHAHVAWDANDYWKFARMTRERTGTHIHTAIYDEAWGFADKQKESSMNRTEVITAELARLQAELATRSKFGEDTYDEASVLRFSGDYGNGGTKYLWAAVKAGGRWHLTGSQSQSNLSWSALVDFFIRADVKKMHLMVKGERIV